MVTKHRFVPTDHLFLFSSLLNFFLLPNSLPLKNIIKVQTNFNKPIFYYFSFFLIMAACRKNWRSDKNEEGQPFFTFTKLHYHHPCWLLQCVKKTVIHSFHWFLFIRNYFQIADIYLHIYIFAYTRIHMYTKEIIILYYLLKFPGGRYLFKHNEITSEDQTYPSCLNFIRNISVAPYFWNHGQYLIHTYYGNHQSSNSWFC